MLIKNLKRKLILVILLIFTILNIGINNIYGKSDSILEKAGDTLKLDNFISTLEKYMNDNDIDTISLDDIAKDSIQGKKIDFSNITEKIINILAKEILIVVKVGISIIIIIIISAIFKSIQLEENSSIINIVNLVTFMLVVTLLGNTYIDLVKIFSQTVSVLCSIIQISTPFIIGILIATGGAITATTIQPLILFIASLIGIIINYFVIPFISLGLCMKIVSGISESLKLEKIGGVFTKTATFTISIVFAIFLGIISIESQVASSLESVTIKGAQAAVSNVVPVVGKFVSDSLEIVMGSAEVIGKVAGTIGIISLVIISIMPIIKFVLVFVCQKITSSIAESLGADSKLVKIIDGFADTYKTMLGVLIGVIVIFIISIAVILNLMGVSSS